MKRERIGTYPRAVRRHRALLCSVSIAALVLAAGVAGAQSTSAQKKAASATIVTDTSAVLAEWNANQAVQTASNALREPTLTNDRRAILHTDRGVAHARLRQHKAAIEDFNRAAQLFPEHAPIYNNRGNILLALGHAREAIKDFERAILLAPGYSAAYNNRGNALLSLGETAEAIKDFSKALELMPSNPASLTGRGKALLLQDRPYAAIRDFTRAVQSDGRLALGYQARAEAKLAVERYEEAVEDLSRAAAFDLRNGEILRQRADAYLMAGNPAAAIKDFTSLLQLEPKSASAYAGRGLAHARAEAFEEAEADLTRALELEPRSALAFAYRAYLYKKSGQADLAQKEIDKASRLEPARVEVVWARAEVEEALGSNDEAVASFRAALAARPGLRFAIDGLQRLGAETMTTDSEVQGAGVERWQVVKRSARYFAINPLYPKLRVPLEMIGEGQPKLLDWEVKKAPHKGVGVLRFASGKAPIDTSVETVEQIAIVDLASTSVLAVHIDRHGSNRRSKWTWEDDKIIVASLDGVSEEIALRKSTPSSDEEADKETAKPAPTPRRVASEGGGSSRSSSGGGTPSWAPWAQPTWSGSNDNRPRSASQRQQKPKTLFEMLFGN
jgi:tetratricopeptide (TPR) repeat protein